MFFGWENVWVFNRLRVGQHFKCKFKWENTKINEYTKWKYETVHKISGSKQIKWKCVVRRPNDCSTYCLYISLNQNSSKLRVFALRIWSEFLKCFPNRLPCGGIPGITRVTGRLLSVRSCKGTLRKLKYINFSIVHFYFIKTIWYLCESCLL